MNATITLNLIGSDTGSFTIYQNSDSYATAVATNVSANALSAGYSATLDNATTTVRVYSTGTCTNYKDIPVNFGDTTPTFTYRGIQSIDTSTSLLDTNIFHDGKQTVFVSSGPSSPKTFVTTNLGTSWTDVSSSMPTNYGTTGLYNPGDGYFYFMGYSGDQIKYNGSFSSHTNNITLPSGSSIFGYFYYNNAFYVATTTELLRSTDNVNYSSVFSYTTNVSKWLLDHLKGYGNTIYFTTGREIAKSTDNGANWTSIGTVTNSDNIDNLYVEDANKVMYRVEGNAKWAYSTNGGTSFFNSGYLTSQYTALNNASVLLKYGPTYIYPSNNSSQGTYDTMGWSTTDPFSNTTITSNIISNVQINTPSTGSIYRTNVFSAAIVGKRLFVSGYLNTSSTDSTNVVYWDIDSN